MLAFWDWTYCCTFEDLFLFLSPNVLSSRSFSFFFWRAFLDCSSCFFLALGGMIVFVLGIVMCGRSACLVAVMLACTKINLDDWMRLGSTC